MFPQNNSMGGPPPGTSPQGLTSMLPQELPEGGPTEAMPGASGASGGLKDVFDEVQQVLDALAGILPAQAAEIDEIKQRLAEVLAKAISGGASFRGREGRGQTLASPSNFPA